MAEVGTFTGTWRCAETHAIYNVYALDNLVSGNPIRYVAVPNCSPAFSEELLYVIVHSRDRVQLRLGGATRQFAHTCYQLDTVNSTKTKLIWIGVNVELVMTWHIFATQAWNTLILQISSEAEADGARLSCSKITGEVISSCFIPSPSTTSWLQARILMTPGLRHYLSKSKIAFVSMDGANLTRADDDRCVADIFNVADTPEFTTPLKRRRINFLSGSDTSEKERALLRRQCDVEVTTMDNKLAEA